MNPSLRVILTSLVLWMLGYFLFYPDLLRELHQALLAGRYGIFILYILISFASVLAIQMLVHLARLLSSKVVLAILMLATCTISAVVVRVEGAAISPATFATVGNNLDELTISSFFSAYSGTILLAVILAFLYVACSFVAARRRLAIPTLIQILIIGAVIAAASFVTYYSNGIKSDYAPLLQVPLNAAYAARFALYDGPRTAVSPQVATDPNAPAHLVLVVDESVRFDYFLEATRSLPTPMQVLGEYVSGAVCSDYANALLLTGADPSKLPDITQQLLHQPSLFAYARAEGYSTAWINAYANEPGVYGFFNSSVVGDVDTIFTKQLLQAEHPNYTIDYNLLQQHLPWLKEQRKSFTYINKVGCHFPYERFTPTQPEATPQKTTSSLSNAAYLACIEYNLTSYLELLASHLPPNSLVIYTSDHGQHLGEDPAITLTHCAREQAHPSMASVPAALLGDSVQVQRMLHQLNSWPRTHQALSFAALTSFNSGYYTHADTALYRGPLLYSSGDIFGRSPLYHHRFPQSSGTPNESK